jgi:hypothetical protein
MSQNGIPVAGMTRADGAQHVRAPQFLPEYRRIIAILSGTGSACHVTDRFRRSNRMTADSRRKVSYVRAADGSPLLLSDLPAANTRRWVIRHKANVVAAVRGGLISLEDASQRYKLTAEEFLAWSEAVDRFGISALRATRVQEYRR